jgi:hypothetical protein
MFTLIQGKYAPLLAVLDRLGIEEILKIRGNFLPEMLNAIGYSPSPLSLPLMII